MRTATTKCVILGHKNFGEKDKLIFMYSEDFGKIKVIAKGSRSITSRFTGHLETLNFCIATIYFGPKNIILTEISTEEIFLRKHRNLKTISNALKIAELTNQTLFENQTLENLHQLIRKTLFHLKSSRKKDLILIAYIVKFLDKSGVVPDFKTTPLPLEEKYLKFFHTVKEKSLTEIEKIRLTKEEKVRITDFTKALYSSLDSKLSSRLTFITPSTFSSLSNNKSN